MTTNMFARAAGLLSVQSIGKGTIVATQLDLQWLDAAKICSLRDPIHGGDRPHALGGCSRTTRHR